MITFSQCIATAFVATLVGMAIAALVNPPSDQWLTPYVLAHESASCACE